MTDFLCWIASWLMRSDCQRGLLAIHFLGHEHLHDVGLQADLLGEQPAYISNATIPSKLFVAGFQRKLFFNITKFAFFRGDSLYSIRQGNRWYKTHNYIALRCSHNILFETYPSKHPCYTTTLSNRPIQIPDLHVLK